MRFPSFASIAVLSGCGDDKEVKPANPPYPRAGARRQGRWTKPLPTLKTPLPSGRSCRKPTSNKGIVDKGQGQRTRHRQTTTERIGAQAWLLPTLREREECPRESRIGWSRHGRSQRSQQAQAGLAPILLQSRGPQHQGRNFDKALADFDQAIKLQAGFCRRPTAAEGFVHEKQGDLDKAMVDFDEAIKIRPGFSRSLREQGEYSTRRGRAGQGRGRLR